METFVVVGLIALALVHGVPAVAVRSPAAVGALYGIPAPHGDLALLLRHRAVLFGALAVLLVGAAIVPAWRPPALLACGGSVGSFLVLWATGGPVGEALTRVAWVDLGASALWVAVAVAEGLRT